MATRLSISHQALSFMDTLTVWIVDTRKLSPGNRASRANLQPELPKQNPFWIADYLSRIVGNPLLPMNAEIRVAMCMGYRRYVATEQHPCTLRRVLLA